MLPIITRIFKMKLYKGVFFLLVRIFGSQSCLIKNEVAQEFCCLSIHSNRIMILAAVNRRQQRRPIIRFSISFSPMPIKAMSQYVIQHSTYIVHWPKYIGTKAKNVEYFTYYNRKTNMLPRNIMCVPISRCCCYCLVGRKKWSSKSRDNKKRRRERWQQ